MTEDRRLTTSALLRSLKLGGLVGRVATSVLTDRLAAIGRADPEIQKRRADNLVRNAQRVAETLGGLKGAAMKVGQMLSLHEGLLPPEVTEILRTLQRQAPRVPAEVMRCEVEGALPDFDDLFSCLDPEGFASASIGQVHRATLADGRRVAVKIQYPLIDEIVRADLGNLRRLFKALFGLFTDVDFEPVWEEVRDRLTEELDYRHEAENMRRMSELHAHIPEVIIPEVITQASTRNVLTMELVEGISPSVACAETTDPELRSRWGQVLLEFQYRGLFEHRLLHADPNLANFAFTPSGGVIVYDFGCVKQVPEALATGYAKVFLAVLEDRKHDVPQALAELGVCKSDATPLERELTDPYVDLFARIVRRHPPYTFGQDDLYDHLVELGLANLSQAVEISFPKDIVFVDRSFAGHMGNLSRLKATGPWREMVTRYASASLADATSGGGETPPCPSERPADERAPEGRTTTTGA